MDSVETGGVEGRKSPKKVEEKYYSLGVRPPRLVGGARSSSGCPTARGM